MKGTAGHTTLYTKEGKPRKEMFTGTIQTPITIMIETKDGTDDDYIIHRWRHTYWVQSIWWFDYLEFVEEVYSLIRKEPTESKFNKRYRPPRKREIKRELQSMLDATDYSWDRWE